MITKTSSLAAAIEKFMQEELKLHLPNHNASEVYGYALFPPGKLIRSQLLFHLSSDLKTPATTNHYLAASFIEYHHAYTLIHDDLPCMDNDDLRRGKPSTHKAYGEWQALLTGDGLLSLSYATLVKIRHPYLQSLLRFATWATGPKGLIHGQVMDLSQEMNHNLKSLMQTHELKTARLFQLACLFAYYLSLNQEAPQLSKIRHYLKLGKNLGVYFQLLDDLSELTEVELSAHEKAINPFLKQKDESIKTLNELGHKLKLDLFRLPQTKSFLESALFTPTLKKLLAGKSVMKNHGVELDLVFLS